MEPLNMEAICKNTGTPILSKIIQTPLGKYAVRVCGDGADSVHRVEPNGTGVIKNISVLESNPIESTAGVGNGKDPNAIMRSLFEWFHLYFSDQTSLEEAFARPFKICVPDATQLQITIWKALQENVRSGSTISYGELAKLVDKPNAARAVGSAMRKNPNCMIVPCHRFIKANKDLGNYSAGAVELKKWLLEHEKAMAVGIGTKKYDGQKNNGVAA